MRKVSLQGAPTGTPPQQICWLTNAVRQIASASQDNDITDIGANYTISTAYTTQRTMPASPTLTDVTNVLCTLLSDLAKGGSQRTG